jgi:small-conductance mechanosensitive channel
MNQHGIRVEVVLATILILVAALAGALSINRLMRHLLLRIQPRLRPSSDTALLFTRALNSVLWVCAGLLILNVWGVSATGLWAFLASIAAVIGVGFLAFWTMVSNITASLFIAIWRPFRLGDSVEVLPESLNGRVIERNLMFTVLREKQGTILQVPNNMFFQKMFRVTDSEERYPLESLQPSDKAPAESRSAGQAQDDGAR